MALTGRWRLKVRSDFSSAHQLRHYKGKCEALHGHNFSVEAEVIGTTLDPVIGYLMDFKELKNCLQQVLETLDHKFLNELSAFQKINPTSEVLARYVFDALSTLLLEYPVTLHSVMVAEKGSSMATYELYDDGIPGGAEVAGA
ncbi:MAG: 6-carboxytetrahydropterin synthase QueD [Desulfoplanes sp.]|jgi:6-pyruvoyltetrahydropterin/6-carboxytetrahydropterin synthase|nr:6-carboxytetrahydropterin synthase QueD [Desulfoplanes sp.]MDD4649167.1 6-carboxytetrahydropterin synthase QueD [Desulfoplanes sp.]